LLCWLDPEAGSLGRHHGQRLWPASSGAKPPWVKEFGAGLLWSAVDSLIFWRESYGKLQSCSQIWHASVLAASRWHRSFPPKGQAPPGAHSRGRKQGKENKGHGR